jgi:hypothetical protein
MDSELLDAKKCGPDYIVLGVQKGGTTSLIYHFNQHPDNFTCKEELHFFDEHARYEKGIESYEKNFVSDKKVRGEKTPAYSYLPYAIDRIHKHYPGVKLILILREPISRAYSQHNMFHRENARYNFMPMCNADKFVVPEKIHEGQGPRYYLYRSSYIRQIEYILTKFPREQLYVAISEEVLADPLVEYNKMFSFLGLRGLAYNEFSFKGDIFKGKYKDRMQEKDYRVLHTFFKPLNARLYEFLGRRVEAWENKYTRILGYKSPLGVSGGESGI